MGDGHQHTGVRDNVHHTHTWTLDLVNQSELSQILGSQKIFVHKGNLDLTLVVLQGLVQFDSIRPVKMSATVSMLVTFSYRVMSSEQLGQLHTSHIGRGKFNTLNVLEINA